MTKFVAPAPSSSTRKDWHRGAFATVQIRAMLTYIRHGNAAKAESKAREVYRLVAQLRRIE